MKCEIREICGDWALDIMAGEKVTIYFNSRQNALNVKRILEVDDSIPNAATVCDMKEVVKCKECIYFQDRHIELHDGSKRSYKKGEGYVPISVGTNIGSYCTRIDYAIVSKTLLKTQETHTKEKLRMARSKHPNLPKGE